MPVSAQPKETVLVVEIKDRKKRGGGVSCCVHVERNTVLFLSYLGVGGGQVGGWAPSLL